MKTFYEETYELILELITIPIGLNNVVTRGNYDDFPEKSPYKNFDSYFSQSKYNRTKSLMEEEKLAIILGTEGDGLANTTIAECDYTVKIPMAHGVDSLNVAAASAVAFWQLGRK